MTKYTILKEIKEHDREGEPVEFIHYITKDEKGELHLVKLDYDYNDEDEWCLRAVTFDNTGYDIYEVVSLGEPPIYDEPKVEVYLADDIDFFDHAIHIATDYETGEVKHFELIYARDDPTLPAETRAEVTQ